MEFGFSITALGAALNAKLLAGSTLSISKVMVGSGKATAGTDLTTMTALITPVALATSNTPAVGANNTVSIIVEYRNDLNGGLKEGFWINEVGLFATDPDAGEILYAYATLGDYPQHIRPYAADAIMVRRFVMEFAMKAGVTVSITYSADAAITAAEAAALITDHNANATVHQNLKISFTEATQRSNIYDGLSLAACLGRIKKWFADMKSAAFCESADFAGATHAAQHATGGADAITPEAIGAAKVNHNHSAADVGADPSGAAAAVQANLAAHAGNTTAHLTATERTAWNGKANTTTLTATVPVAWTASGDFFYQNVSVPGILASDNPVTDILTGTDNAANKLYAEAWGKVLRATTYDGGVQIWCTEAPTVAFPLQFKVVR